MRIVHKIFLLVLCLFLSVLVCGCSLTTDHRNDNIGEGSSVQTQDTNVVEKEESTFFCNNLSWDSKLDDFISYYHTDPVNSYDSTIGSVAYVFNPVECDDHTAKLTAFFSDQNELVGVYLEFNLESYDDVKSLYSHYIERFSSEYGESGYSLDDDNVSGKVWYTDKSSIAVSSLTVVYKMVRIQYLNRDFVHATDE